jgi:glycosyltransferase involved in cell wall biosynthesis
VVHFFQVAKRLCERGHEVTIQAPEILDLEVLPKLPKEVSVQKIPGVSSNLYTLPPETQPLRFLPTLKDLTVGLRSIAKAIPRGTEIVHAGFHPNAKAALFAREKFGWEGKIVQAVHMDPETFIPESFKKRYSFLFREIPYRVDHLLTVCEPLHQKLQRYRRPVTNVRNGVAPIFLETPLEIRRPDPSRPVFYFCGAIGRRKGIDSLLQSFAEVLKRSPNAQLILSGRGSWEGYYLGMARSLGILDQVDYRGVVSLEEMVRIMDSATVFIFPTWSEGFGLPPLEAMARECPVITTVNEGTAQYVEHGKNCLLVAPGNPEELTQAIETLLGNPGLAQRIGKGGRSTAAQYTWEEVTDRTERAMLETLDA